MSQDFRGNISEATADAIRREQGRRGGSKTAALQRLVALADLIVRAVDADGEAVGRMSIGERLWQLRVDHGMTQTEIAALVGAEQNRVSNWEKGEHIPTLPTLARYAAAFEMSLPELLDEVDVGLIEKRTLRTD